jgi:hypothetical protein
VLAVYDAHDQNMVLRKAQPAITGRLSGRCRCYCGRNTRPVRPVRLTVMVSSAEMMVRYRSPNPSSRASSAARPAAAAPA